MVIISSSNQQFRIAVVGAGISGLAATYELTRNKEFQTNFDVQVTLFEAGKNIGGVLQSVESSNCLIEKAADMITTIEPDALELADEIGFTNWIGTNKENRRAFICLDSQLHPIPEGFVLMSPNRPQAVWDSPILSQQGKRRLFEEESIAPPTEKHSDESLESFATRRFGKEAFERLIQPLISGIYTADPSRLSMNATMKKFVRQEQEFGSIIKASKAESIPDESSQNDAGARYGKFIAPQKGISQFVKAIYEQVDRSGKVRTTLNTRVDQIVGSKEGWALRTCDTTTSDSSSQTESFDAIVLALPAHASASLLKEPCGELASKLSKIRYASAAIVIHVFNRCDIEHPLDGFGFVVPQIENSPLIATSFASNKFAGRASDDQIVLRSFVGGDLNPQILDKSDREIESDVESALNTILGVRGEAVFKETVRWDKAMAQYHVGHLDLIDEIEHLAKNINGFALAGNGFRGVGIPACIRSGRMAAKTILSQLLKENEA